MNEHIKNLTYFVVNHFGHFVAGEVTSRGFGDKVLGRCDHVGVVITLNGHTSLWTADKGGKQKVSYTPQIGPGGLRPL